MRTRRAKWREPSQIGPLAIVVAAAIAVLILLAAGGRGHADRRTAPTAPASWEGLVGEGRPPVSIGQRLIVVLKAPSVADRLTRAGGFAGEGTERAWADDVVSRQRKLFSRLALQGVEIHPDFTYTRVLNGFAAALDPRAVSLLERAPEVRGVYPVRATYPASTSTSRFDEALKNAVAGGRPPGVVLPGFDGTGVTVALLDTGVDRTSPYLAHRLAPGVDIVSPGGAAEAQVNPADPTEIERHGTEMAGVVIGHHGPYGLHGVAPGATLQPVRVAGWQPDASGSWAVYGRSDQLIAGLEAAVDPNGDGDTHDAARIALVGVTEPYAAFGDGPEARAVNGAQKLDTVVVVPAGNDGPAGPVYGSISGPAGASEALAVGAADLRTGTADVRVAVRSGLETMMSRVLPLAGAIAPSGTLALDVSGPRGSAARLSHFFDPDGSSRVAGRAAFVKAGPSSEIAVENAAQAGADAVLLHGVGLPAGSLGLDETVTVPVIAIPEPVARRMRAQLDAGRGVTVALGSAGEGENSAARRVAGFSSRGLAFDGRVKPDLVGPGVSIPTSEPGQHDDGTARFVTVNGSSVSAASVAGTLALLAQARPDLSAFDLKGVLTGAAHPISGDPVSAQGAGLVDVGNAATASIVAEPATLALSPARPGRALHRSFLVRNVSRRAVRVTISSESPVDGGAVSASPRRLRLPSHGTAVVRVTAHGPAGGKSIGGALRLAVRGRTDIRVPWVVASATRVRLLAGLCLAPGYAAPCSKHALNFTPSDTAPAVLSLRAGEVVTTRGLREVRPVARLEVNLRKVRDQKKLGTLVELRDLLPGQYAFGLTGRGPAGQRLVPGLYEVTVRAFPTASGRPTQSSLRFTIRR